VTEVEPRPLDATREDSAAAADVVSRLIGVAQSLRRWTLRLALAATGAAAVIVYAIVRDGFPSDGKAVLAVIGIIVAAGPPLMLAAFWLALGQLVKLPARVRRLPLESREHGEQLRYLLDQARAVRGSRFQLPRLLWRLTRLAGSVRETLTPYAPLLPLLSLPFLVGAALAAFAGWIEILVACIVAIVLAVG
jgi:hypothetical protein